ncbi:hypothetical protein [Desulfosporosinus sp. Sb-LF]|nr:hypothetical protein [Desulfosporosinus sp. Sb-LF]
MNHSKILFSNLTNDQIEEVKALEAKFNTQAHDQETILIAYTNPTK